MSRFFLLFDELKATDEINDKFDSEVIGLDDFMIKDGSVSLRIIKGDMVIIEGKLSFKAMLTCSRCGKNFEKPFTENFHREYILGRDPYSSVPQVGLKRDDLDRVYFQDTGIDLSEAIREAVITAIPMAPHCREDCKGICPYCGQDLNIKECSCPKQGEKGWLEEFLENTDK